MDAARTAGGLPGTGAQGPAASSFRDSSPAPGNALLLVAILGLLVGMACALLAADALERWWPKEALRADRPLPAPKRTTSPVEVRS